jgi:hypothetical protein
MRERSFYNNAQVHSVSRKLSHLIGPNKSFYIRGDGQIALRREFNYDGPWVYTPRRAYWQDCTLWHKVLFDHVFDGKIVPSPCQDCYKVVAMPRTVKELFEIKDYQWSLNWPGKCGTEGDRKNTNRLYGAYWYCRGLEHGREVWEAVRKDVDVNIPVILKRACTEYEQQVGPSDKWVVTKDQLEIEAVVQRAFVNDTWDFHQTDDIIAGIQAGWIENAYRWGDETYKEFTNGEPMNPPPVTYHDAEKKEAPEGWPQETS